MSRDSFYATIALRRSRSSPFGGTFSRSGTTSGSAIPSTDAACTTSRSTSCCPGMMSLASLLATGESRIWRASFTVFGILGALESLLVLPRRTRAAGVWLRVRADVVSAVLFGFVALVAAWTSLPARVGIDLRPLELEGLLPAALLLLGIGPAAAIFVTTDAPTTPAGG